MNKYISDFFPSGTATFRAIVVLAGALACIAAAPENAAVNERVTQAESLIRAGKDDAAYKLLQAVVAGERNAQAFADLGRLAMRRNDRALAIKQYEEAVAIEGKNPGYLRDLGIIYLLDAKEKTSLVLAIKGQSALKQSLSLSPSNVAAQIALIQFYAQAPAFVGGSLTKARAQILELKKHDRFYGDMQAAQLDLTDKKWSDARAGLADAMAARPNAVPALRLAAELGRQHPDDNGWAQEKIAQTLGKLPAGKTRDAVDLRCLLGGLLDAAGNRAEAVEQYRKALELDPDCEEAQTFLSQAKE